MLAGITNLLYGPTQRVKPCHILFRDVFEQNHLHLITDEALARHFSNREFNQTKLNQHENNAFQLLESFYRSHKPSTRSWVTPAGHFMRMMIAHANSINLDKVDFLQLNCFIKLTLIADEASIVNLRPAFLKALYQKGYFKDPLIIRMFINTVINTNKRRAFFDLLSFPRIIPRTKILDYARQFFKSLNRTDALNYDLFIRLNPDDYEGVNWRALTSYEQLYWIVHEHYFSKSLSHRLCLEGHFTPQWRGYPYHALALTDTKKQNDLEGMAEDLALMQFKSSLYFFQTNFQGDKQTLNALTKAVDLLSSMKPRNDAKFNHRLRDGLDHVYLFGLSDHHFTCGYHATSGKYYHINMGSGSGERSGVIIYNVSPSQKANLHCDLCCTQYEHKTKHFNRIPSKNNLTETYFLQLPEQITGNCTYESLRGLLVAIVVDELSKTMPMKQATVMTLDMVRLFIEMDMRDAIVDYTQHALSPNRELLTLAYQNMQTCLDNTVLDDKQFKLIQNGKKILTHRYQSKPNRRLYQC